MNKEQLQSQLSQLHEELAAQPTLDESNRALLQQLAGDIQLLLDDDTSAEEGLVERLEQQSVRFESDHPTLGSTLRQIIDALGRMGI